MNVIVRLFLTGLLLGQLSNTQVFYQRILDDYDDHSFFVALDVGCAEFTSRVIIENGDLYSFLRQTRGFSKLRYKAFMSNLLIKSGRLMVGNQKLAKWGFLRVDKLNNVAAYASKRQDEFIGHYFNGRVMREQVGNEERSAIINQLFNWKIATKVDDESAYRYSAVATGDRQA